MVSGRRVRLLTQRPSLHSAVQTLGATCSAGAVPCPADRRAYIGEWQEPLFSNQPSSLRDCTARWPGALAEERWLTGVEAEGQARVCQGQSQLACSPAAQWQATVGLHHQQALCDAVKQLMQPGNWGLQARLSSHPGWSSACSIREQCVLLQSGKIHLCPCNAQTGWPLCGQGAASRSSEA